METLRAELKAFEPGVIMDKFLEGIADWILADSKRRILLLLDEADRFWELDGKKEQGGEYIRAARLKGLMDRTNRRFKVAFVGLHNVRRTTTLGNHPPAHYGAPRGHSGRAVSYPERKRGCRDMPERPVWAAR